MKSFMFLFLLMPLLAESATQQSALPLLPGEGAFQTNSGGQPVEGMVSNSVTQMRIVASGGDTLVFGANSFGVLRSSDFGSSFETYTDSCGLGRGGVSGLDANEWLVAASTVIDTSIANVQGAGTGVAYSEDGGLNWSYLPQPMDMVADTTGVIPQEWVALDCVTGDSLDWLIETAVVTNVENITWGLACEGDSAIWAASFAGGFRRYSLNTECWEMYVPNTTRFAPAVDDSDVHLNHRAFSVLATRDGIWAGSAGGLNFLQWDDLHADGHNRLGGDWVHFDYQHPQPNGDPTITGNWVVSMARREMPDGSDQVWVGGWATFATVGDYFGLSWTPDNGDTWTEVTDLRNKKVWDLAFDEEDIYVATSEGLWKSDDHGRDGSWNLYGPIRDSVTGREMIYDDVYAVGVAGGRLLVGGSRGLFTSTDKGNTWTSQHHKPLNLVAFPNPFSPNAHERATFAIEASSAGSVQIEVYDFAMDLVRIVADGEAVSGGRQIEFYWDGRNRQGEPVANGVYFYRVEAPGGSRWGKLMVVK